MSSASLVINLDQYRTRFLAQVGLHIADMQAALQVLGSEDAPTVALFTPAPGISVEYTAVDPRRAVEQRQAANCFRLIMADFVRFLDQMIATRDLLGKPVVGANISSPEETLAAGERQITTAIKHVSGNAKLKNPEKLRKFAGLSEAAIKAVLSFFDLRNALEHHGGVPSRI